MANSLLTGLATSANTAARFGVLDPCLTTARAAGLLRWGPTVSAMVHAAALRWPRRNSIVDDFGELSYRNLDRMADRLARSLRTYGSGPVGDSALTSAGMRRKTNERGMPVVVQSGRWKVVG